MGSNQQHPEPTQVAASPIGNVGAPASQKTSSFKLKWTWIGVLFLTLILGLVWWMRPTPESLPRSPSGLKVERVKAERAKVVRVEEKAPAPTPSQAKHQPSKKHKKTTPPFVQPTKPKKPTPKAIMEINCPTSLLSSLDHKPVSQSKIVISDHASHLLRFHTPDKKTEIMLRLSPKRAEIPQTSSWYLHLRATPWMRINLNGQQQGQTPRSGLVLDQGKHNLSLQRDDRVYSVVFVIFDNN